jgi:hypothetical protein
LSSGRKLAPLNFEESSLEIGGFKARDFFEDGSFYVLDVPGVSTHSICATKSLLVNLNRSTFRATSPPSRA